MRCVLKYPYCTGTVDGWTEKQSKLLEEDTELFRLLAEIRGQISSSTHPAISSSLDHETLTRPLHVSWFEKGGVAKSPRNEKKVRNRKKKHPKERETPHELHNATVDVYNLDNWRLYTDFNGWFVLRNIKGKVDVHCSVCRFTGKPPAIEKLRNLVQTVLGNIN